LGLWVRRRRSAGRIAGRGDGRPLIFRDNKFRCLGDGHLYPQTLAGLVACYVAAIPFSKTPY